jgi:hypothetical protein
MKDGGVMIVMKNIRVETKMNTERKRLICPTAGENIRVVMKTSDERKNRRSDADEDDCYQQ